MKAKANLRKSSDRDLGRNRHVHVYGHHYISDGGDDYGYCIGFRGPGRGYDRCCKHLVLKKELGGPVLNEQLMDDNSARGCGWLLISKKKGMVVENGPVAR